MEQHDQQFWDQHWHQGDHGSFGSMADNPANPYLAQELSGILPGTALDAGCGAGAEAIWLADRGWDVTAVDISETALGFARSRAQSSGSTGRVVWRRADLDEWTPARSFDLVITNYAHSALPQSDFFARIAGWVAPRGTLLIVGHGITSTANLEPAVHDSHSHGNGHGHGHGHGHSEAPPAEVSATSHVVAAHLDAAEWVIDHAGDHERPMANHIIHDFVVRASRR